MGQRAGDRAITAAVVLVAVCLACIGALHFRRRPDPGGLLAFDLGRGTLVFAERAETAWVHLHAIGPGVVVVSGADTCNNGPHGEQLYAYSMPGGQLRWQRRLKGACGDFDPVDPVSEGTVAVSVWPALEGWSAADGSTRWRTTAFPGALRPSADRIVSVDSNTGAVRFLDPRSGRLLQSGVARSKPFPWAVTSTAAILVTQSNEGPLVDSLTALDPVSGQRRWQRTLGSTGGFGAPSGADGVALAGWEGMSGSLGQARTSYAAFDAASGKRLWLRRGYLDLAAAGSGLALFVHGDSIEADDLHTGELRWRRRLAGWRAGGYRTIVAREGAVAVVDQDRVTVLRARDGTARWTRRLPTDGLAARGAPAINDGLLVIPASSSSFTPYDE